MGFVIFALVWLCLAIVSSISFYKPVKFSDIERQRLAASKNKQAILEKEYLDKIPLLESFKNIVVVLMTVMFVSVSVIFIGGLLGIVLSAVGLLVVPLLYRVSFICRLADALLVKISPTLDKIIDFIAPALRWLRSRDVARDDILLNSQDELLEIIGRSSGILTIDQKKRLVASLELDDKLVRDIMTPRSVIDSVGRDEVLGPLTLSDLHKTGHSRFPVINGDIDHVVGVLYVRDLLMVDPVKNSKKVHQVMDKEVCFIREDQNLEQALGAFLKTQKLLFVVVNEFRETVGLVSLEDVIEALLGQKINDEFEKHSDLRAVAARNPRKNNLSGRAKDVS